MIKRIYLFIILGCLIENMWRLWEVAGYDADFVYYRIFISSLFLKPILLPVWWICQRFRPVAVKFRDETWVFLIAVTYFTFEAYDAYQMRINENSEPSIVEFLLFIAFNLTYYFIFRKKT